MREYALLGLLSLLWGSSFTLIKVAVADYPPATLAALRIFVGGMALLVLAKARGLVFPRSARRWGELLLQGVLQGALPFSLISWAELHLASGLAGVLNSTVPMFVFVISVFALRSTPFAALKFVGVLAGLGGVATLAGAQTLTQLSASGALPVLAVLAASLSYACGALFGHRFADQSPVVTAACSLLGGSMLMLPLCAALDAPWTLAPRLAPTLALLALSLLSTALASVIFFRLVRTLGSLATTTNAYLRALVSLLLGALLLGEPLTWPVGIATLLIFTGVALVTRRTA